MHMTKFAILLQKKERGCNMNSTKNALLNKLNLKAKRIIMISFAVAMMLGMAGFSFGEEGLNLTAYNGFNIDGSEFDYWNFESDGFIGIQPLSENNAGFILLHRRAINTVPVESAVGGNNFSDYVNLNPRVEDIGVYVNRDVIISIPVIPGYSLHSWTHSSTYANYTNNRVDAPFGLTPGTTVSYPLVQNVEYSLRFNNPLRSMSNARSVHANFVALEISVDAEGDEETTVGYDYMEYRVPFTITNERADFEDLAFEGLEISLSNPNFQFLVFWGGNSINVGQHLQVNRFINDTFYLNVDGTTIPYPANASIYIAPINGLGIGEYTTFVTARTVRGRNINPTLDTSVSWVFRPDYEYVTNENNVIVRVPSGYLYTFKVNQATDRTVTFDLDGGNINGNTNNIVREVPHGQQLGNNRIPSPHPVREGYTFLGWRCDDNDTLFTLDDLGDLAAEVINSNRTFVAEWELRECNCPPGCDGGDDCCDEEKNCTCSGCDCEDCLCEDCGCDDDDKDCCDECECTNYHTVVFTVGNVYGRFATGSGAIRENGIYTITFTVPHNTLLRNRVPSNPTRNGYYFVRWYDYDTEDGYYPQPLRGVRITEDRTFVANWRFIYGNGTGNPPCDCDLDCCGPDCDNNGCCDDDGCCADEDGNRRPGCQCECICEDPGDNKPSCNCPSNNGNNGNGCNCPPGTTGNCNCGNNDCACGNSASGWGTGNTPPGTGSGSGNNNSGQSGGWTNQATPSPTPSPTPGNQWNPNPSRPAPLPVPRPPVEPQGRRTHRWYIQGYPEGDVRADGFMTRAEMAAMFFNLSESPDKLTAFYNAGFPDVRQGDWHFRAINYAAVRHNALSGFPDGRFRPNQHITFAEFAAFATGFFNLRELAPRAVFAEQFDHWAADFLAYSFDPAWFSYFGHGFVLVPDAPIPRSIAVTLLNHYTGRIPNPEEVRAFLQGQNIYFDIRSSNHWAFYEIMTASITHTFTVDEAGNQIWDRRDSWWLVENRELLGNWWFLRR